MTEFSDLRPTIRNHGPNDAWVTDRYGKKHWLPVGETVEVDGPASGEGVDGMTNLEVYLET